MTERLGIVGGGQLAQMLALAAKPLGIACSFLDANPEAPAKGLGNLLLGELDDVERLGELAAQSDVVTFDIENVDTELLGAVRDRTLVRPNLAALAIAQDRLSEKNLFQEVGIGVAPFVAIGNRQDLDSVGERIGFPAVLKARRLGYDGRGQRFVSRPEELEPAWEELGRPEAIAEARVDFKREVSLVAARGVDGEIAFYPLATNHHEDGILRITRAPDPQESLQTEAEGYLRTLLSRLEYVGVLTVEFFVDQDDLLLANEMAPRVHNSGHWTIEGAVTSQFENHVRAVMGWPLGSTEAVGHAAMVNLIGQAPPTKALLALPGVRLHDYGKSPRPGRKIGHCTLVERDATTLSDRLAPLEQLVAAHR